MSTGISATCTDSFFSLSEECHHAFISDNRGGTVCCLCGLVAEENITNDSHFILTHTHSTLNHIHTNPATCLGFPRERSEKYYKLNRKNTNTGYIREKKMFQYFRNYLTQIDFPLSIHMCMADYRHIAQNLPKGKARSPQSLSAVLLILRLRSYNGLLIRIRPLLQNWDVTISDYYTVIQLLHQIPSIHSWIKTMEVQQPSYWQILTNTFNHAIRSLSIDHVLANYAYRILGKYYLVNRSDIQIAAALLATRELHPEIPCVSIQTILHFFPKVSEERIYHIKCHFLQLILSRSEAIPITPTSNETIIPKTHPKSRLKILNMTCKVIPRVCFIIFIPCINQIYSFIRTIRLFFYSKSILQHLSRGKQINIRQRYFPPPAVTLM